MTMKHRLVLCFPWAVCLALFTCLVWIIQPGPRTSSPLNAPPSPALPTAPGPAPARQLPLMPTPPAEPAPVTVHEALVAATNLAHAFPELSPDWDTMDRWQKLDAW